MLRMASAIIVLICTVTFCLINFWNLLRKHKYRRRLKVKNDLPPPKGALFSVSAFLTLIFWFTVAFYPFLVFFGDLDRVSSVLLDLSFIFPPFFRWLGLTLLVFGFLLFSWSVIVRDLHTTSWKMPEGHKLVTWGPYSLVRHPSYLSYFIMFFGLFLLWPNTLTLSTTFAIPGYIKITDYEERMLIRRFGDEYKDYQRKVGKFLPKIKKLRIQID